MPFLYGKPDIQSVERQENTNNQVLKEIEVHHNTSKNHLSNVSVHLSNIKNNSDITATKLTNIQTINDTKLSAIQNFLDKDHSQFIHKHNEAILGSDDGTTSGNKIPIRVDTDGKLILSNPSGSSDSTSANQIDIISNIAVSNTHLTSIKNFLDKDNSNFINKHYTVSNLIGNTSSDGSGSNNHLHIDSNGNAKTQVVNTVNIAPANTVNGDLSPSQSFNCKINGKDSGNNSRVILTDTDGKLVISNPSSSTSDATASNQTTIISNQGTANSSLNSIDSKLTTNNNSLTSIESDVEATNGLLGTTNTKLGTIETDIESTNTLLGTTNTKLGTIETDIESTNTLLGTTNSKLTSIESDIENTNTILTSIQNSQIIKRDVTTISSTSLSGSSETSSVDIQNYKSLHWHFVNAVTSGSLNLTLEGSHDNSNFHSDVNFFSNKHQLLNATYKFYRVRNEDLSSFSFDRIEVTKLNL
tara:strand:+ start:585 stop:2000 length:1416 start_codon:yes stop_codon:yes gene_type:complete